MDYKEVFGEYAYLINGPVFEVKCPTCDFKFWSGQKIKRVIKCNHNGFLPCVFEYEGEQVCKHRFENTDYCVDCRLLKKYII
jgi:hypothetical protein